MSENVTKAALINFELPPSIDNAVKNLTDKPTNNVGQTLADCWYLVFGGISQAANKRKLQYSNDLELFNEELNNKINAIPTNKRIEPDIHV